jgi:photosystem II stability/assembly factor-like uncharacterized protein
VSETTKELFNAFCIDTANVFVVGTEGTILHSQNGGTKWTQVDSHTTNDLRSVQFFDDKRGIIIGSGGIILRTTDSGTTWMRVETDFPLSLFGVAIN